MRNFYLNWITLCLLVTSCGTPLSAMKSPEPKLSSTNTPANNQIPPTKVFTSLTATQAPTFTPQARLTSLPLGPDADKFGTGINPLTGLAVKDPSMLDLPAVLVSISNMPPTARPQAGTSFAPWIYELFIGEGTSRFMGVFYGDTPRRIANDIGNCKVNTNIFQPNGSWIGNRVWLDENADGVQDPWEVGVSGVCITLTESYSGKEIAITSTNSNGYYAFDAKPLKVGNSYTLTARLPDAYQFTLANVGNDDQDSDSDPQTGRIDFISGSTSDASLDTGLVLVKPGEPVFSPSDIATDRTYVGPIRSGRLTYNDFAQTYPASCLIYASAGNGIRELLDGCEIIFGEQPGLSPNTALLDVSHLIELAKKSKIANQPVNYSGHLFDPKPPAGGLVGTSLWTFFHAFTQAFWQYDPVSASYLRQTDDGDGLGVFHPDTDRLTGRQLAFENVVIIMANYLVFRHGQYDIDLCCGREGYAFLFRDGKMYKIRWSTNNREWEKTTGLLRPLHFTGVDKQPFAMKPGRTWVSIMTTNSALKDLGEGKWQALFAMPDDYGN